MAQTRRTNGGWTRQKAKAREASGVESPHKKRNMAHKLCYSWFSGSHIQLLVWGVSQLRKNHCLVCGIKWKLWAEWIYILKLKGKPWAKLIIPHWNITTLLILIPYTRRPFYRNLVTSHNLCLTSGVTERCCGNVLFNPNYFYYF